MLRIFSLRNIFFIFFLIGLTFVFLPLQAVLASETNGTISGYAWSSQIGWVNFGTTGGNTHITDSAVTGYAWNENTGRINLNPTNSGVVNNAEGSLSGKAWNEGTGWINFSGVLVNSSGIFSGTATGDNSVVINFNCDRCNVATDWRPLSARTTPPPSPPPPSSGGGAGSITFPSPSGPFSLLINNGSGYTNTSAATLSLNGGPDATEMALSSSPDFINSVKETYQKNKVWQFGTGDGLKTVYVKFYTNHGMPSPVISASIVLDTKTPQIAITSIKNTYNSSEDVIIGGTTEANAEVNLFLGNQYGAIPADQSGNWAVNLGKLSVGTHHVDFYAKDLAQNTSNTIGADFLVVLTTQPETPLPFPFTLAPPLAPILRQFADKILSLIPKFFGPLEKNQPQVAITIPKEAPLAFKGNLFNFHYISSSVLARLVLRPLPADVRLLAQKFPEIGKTLAEVGITQITDLQKLSGTNLKLPNLTQTILPKPVFAVGNFAIPKGIPVENLSAIAKSKIPSEIVFAKASGGLVDLNVALSINNKGATQQTIQTISGQSVQLVVKPQRPVSSITGYVVFKSKNSNSSESKTNLNNMSASLLFANPDLTAAVLPSVQIPIEGMNANQQLALNTAPASLNVLGIEKRLVVSTFIYQDTGNGVYTSLVQMPVVDGQYEIITIMNYKDTAVASKEITLVTLVDPEGYIYEKSGDLETRILGAIASLYWLNPDSQQYELWPAKDFQQQNPQTTDVRGSYSFLVPDGYYYLKVDAPGYLSYDGKPFEVKEGSGVHINIELKVQYWFLKIIDWKTLLLIIVLLMLGYNFYRDKIREKNKNNLQMKEHGIK